MNLEIHKPELIQRVNAHLQTCHFHDADELLEKALDTLGCWTPISCPKSESRSLNRE